MYTKYNMLESGWIWSNSTLIFITYNYEGKLIWNLLFKMIFKSVEVYKQQNERDSIKENVVLFNVNINGKRL